MAERAGRVKEVEINVHTSSHNAGHSRLLIGTEDVFLTSVSEVTVPLGGNALNLLGRNVRYDTTISDGFSVLTYFVID